MRLRSFEFDAFELLSDLEDELGDFANLKVAVVLEVEKHGKEGSHSGIQCGVALDKSEIVLEEVRHFVARVHLLLAFHPAEVGLVPAVEVLVLEVDGVVLFPIDLVEAVHVELTSVWVTCRTNDSNLQWRKYLGRTCSMAFLTSFTTNSVPSSLQPTKSE